MPTASDSKPAWLQCDINACVWTDFGDGYVVYHRPSGKTHLMNASSVRLIQDLLQRPLDLDSIAAKFDPPDGNSRSDEYFERLEEMLHRLEQFGLIEQTWLGP